MQNMSAPNEPEKYSIDEMMERLKSRPAEDPIEQGELVTRADGTQAIRVRRRKRRSHQPHKEERKKTRQARVLQVSGVLILILLAIFVAGSAIVYANSSPFREGVIRKISLITGARVELEQFRVTPTRANAGRLLLAWPEGNVLRDLTVRGVSATISPTCFLGKTLTGEEVTSEDGVLTLRGPVAGQPMRVTPATDEPPSVRFNRYAIPKLQVRVGDHARPLLILRDTEGSFEARNASGRPQLLLNRGAISFQGWPNFQMDRSHIEFRGGEVDIVGMRLLHEGDRSGLCDLSGTISPYATDRPSTLALRLESYPLAGIVGPELGRLLSGRIDSVSSAKSNYLVFTPGPEPATTLVVSFRSSLASSMEVRGFPFLFNLARLLEDTWFENPVFMADATGTIRRSDGEVAIEDLNLENKSRIALRGGLTITADRRLAGNLEVCIAEAMAKASGNRRLDSLLGPPMDGFRWVSLKITGSAAAPKDNFLELYDASVPQEKTAPAGNVPSFEQLTAPE